MDKAIVCLHVITPGRGPQTQVHVCVCVFMYACVKPHIQFYHVNKESWDTVMCTTSYIVKHLYIHPQ